MTDPAPTRHDAPDDEWCPCTLISYDHRKSAHESVDLEEAIRAYMSHLPREYHGVAIESMYRDGQDKQARRLQKIRNGMDR